MSLDKQSVVFLYLSRHGATYDNLGIRPESPDAQGPQAGKSVNDIADFGMKQARILAQYLGLFIFDGFGKDEVGVLSSSDQRSIDTAEEIMRFNRIPLYTLNSSPLLREEIPKEFLSLPENPALELVERYSRLRPKAVLAERFSAELEHYIRRMDCRVIVAPLHGNMNAVFMEHIGLTPFIMDNCSILPLKYEDRKFTQNGDYVTNDDMKRLLEDE